MRILGIDPGTTRIGFGVIETKGGAFTHIQSGILPLPPAVGSARLLNIERELERLIREVQPEKIGVEKLFFSKNKKTALAVAEARGVIMHTILKHGIPVLELTPNEVKVAVTSNGNASKDAVAKMVAALLTISISHLLDDATDALAIAIASANTRSE